MGRNLLLIILGGIVLAAGTFFHQPKELTVVGNVCGDSAAELCLEWLPTAGFPLAYLHDSPGTSIVGSVGPEDRFNFAAFVFDAAFFMLVLSFVTDQARKVKHGA
jgi:hypothetical protein